MFGAYSQRYPKESEARSLIAHTYGEDAVGADFYSQSTGGTTVSSLLCRTSVILPWLLVAILSVCLMTSQSKAGSTTQGKPGPNSWFDTDFAPAKRETTIPYREIKFNAAVRYNSTGQIFRVPDGAGDVPYVGPPTVEIDRAWDDLCKYIDILMTADEAREVEAREPPVTGRLIEEPVSGLYIGAPAVLHDLHCLNMIRMALYPDYYADHPHMSISSRAVHIEHCIDAIRLSLMCAGDMTLIPGVWSENGHTIIPDFERTHTCRDFDVIKDWQKSRDATNPRLWQEVATRLKGERS